MSMLTFATPSFAAGRYSFGSTPTASAILPPAALIRSTSSFGTEDEPCMTSGKPGSRTWIFLRTSKWSDWRPLNL